MLLVSLLSHFRNSSEISKAWNNHKQSYVIIYHEISVELLKIKNKDVNVVPQHEAAHVSISKKKKKKRKEREMYSFSWVTATLQLNETEKQWKMNAHNNPPH